MWLPLAIQATMAGVIKKQQTKSGEKKNDVFPKSSLELI